MANTMIDEKEIIEFIVDTLYSSRISFKKLENEKFHHSTSYTNAPLVCKYGLLTLADLNKFGIRNDSQQLLEIMNDAESHINGNNGISLAVLGLKDLYNYESEYNPLNSSVVDFIISKKITAYRNTLRYGNEYIHYGSIGLENILSLNFRILEYISLNGKEKISNDKLIEMYNSLLQSAINIKNLGLDLLLRELSPNGLFSIDIDKFSKSDKLVLRK